MLDVQLAVVPAAGHAPEPLELVAAQRVEPLVAGRVLHEAGLVAEPVVAVLAHAVKVGLVLAVVAVGELAVLVEPAEMDKFVRKYEKMGETEQCCFVNLSANVNIISPFANCFLN